MDILYILFYIIIFFYFILLFFLFILQYTLRVFRRYTKIHSVRIIFVSFHSLHNSQNININDIFIIRCYWTNYSIQTGSNSSNILKILKLSLPSDHQVSDVLEYHFKYHLYFHIHVAIIFTKYLIRTNSNSPVKHLKSHKIIDSLMLSNIFLHF